LSLFGCLEGYNVAAVVVIKANDNLVNSRLFFRSQRKGQCISPTGSETFGPLLNERTIRRIENAIEAFVTVIFAPWNQKAFCNKP